MSDRLCATKPDVLKDGRSGTDDKYFLTDVMSHY
jgi:hypothetical protein